MALHRTRQGFRQGLRSAAAVHDDEVGVNLQDKKLAIEQLSYVL